MSGKWEFNRSDPSSVRVEITQRDQFNNDNVGLSETLVREVIQNSSDASVDNGTPVTVRFTIKELNDEEKDYLQTNISALIPHLDACGINISNWTEETVRILVVEDFNTKGLTGSFDNLDKDNFDNFWRAVGNSEKTGQKGGRWGLGKLVYSSSSLIRTFWGLTIRDGDCGPSVMGQVVLENHKLEDFYYPPHGFWFAERSDNDLRLQLPVQDESEISDFQHIFSLTRTDEPGLSVVIPFLIDRITEDSIVLGVVHNYYFPILAGKLEVEVGDTLINADTFLEVAENVDTQNARVPFTFIKRISDALRSGPAFSIETPIEDTKQLLTHLTDEQVEEMKTVFSSGRLVHLRMPISLKPKDMPDQIGYINLFLESVLENDRPFSLFARGPITLPEEHNLRGIIAKGAMIASDGSVAEFLGDAENPAHTKWNSNAGKLTSRWHKPRTTLYVIRHSVRSLYEIISGQNEMQDDNALIDFFSLPNKPTKPDPPPPGEADIRIEPRSGGFRLIAGSATEKWTFPRKIHVRMAYDMIGANPFRHFSTYDFDLKNSEELSFNAINGSATIVEPNVLCFEVSNLDFQLSVNGFDTLRDLVVDAQVLS